ncbi:MAG: hypothetical protein ACRD5L_01025, partial [Bryobacteraceae bacterium]
LETDATHSVEHEAIAGLSEDGAAVPGKEFAYAHGVLVRTFQGEKVLFNAGTRLGYGSFLMLAPEKRAGVLIMGSRTGAVQEAVAEYALSNILQFPSVEDSRPAGAAVAISAEEAHRIAGTYRNSAELTVELSEKDGKMVVVYLGHALPVTKDAKGVYHAAGPLDTFTIERGAGANQLYLCAQLRALRKAH